MDVTLAIIILLIVNIRAQQIIIHISHHQFGRRASVFVPHGGALTQHPVRKPSVKIEHCAVNGLGFNFTTICNKGACIAVQ